MTDPTKIMVVEDDPIGANLLRELLEIEYDLLIAKNGDEALDKLEYFKPEIMLLDVMMPGIDGYEVCRRAREKLTTQDIKIILVTAKGMLEERLEGYRAGADDYITKPFEPKELLAKIQIFERLVHAEEQRKEAEQRLLESNKALEQTVAQRTKELSVSNQQLVYEIEEHKKTAEQIVRSNAYLESSFESAPDGVLLLDQHGKFSYVNTAFLNMVTGVKQDFIGNTFKEVKTSFLSVEMTDMLSVSMASRQNDDRSVVGKEMEVFNKNGEVIPVSYSSSAIKDTTGQVLGEIIFIKDITEQKRMQDLMVQHEKMMSVGGLASGMAHEINNPLSAILQSSQNMIRRLSPDLEKNIANAQRYGIDLNNLHAFFQDQNIHAFIEVIRESGHRAAKIIESMLKFSRKGESKMASNDLNQIIEHTLDLANKEYDLTKKYDFRNINIVKDYDEKLPRVICAETEIQQVILNLLVNAAQAMLETREVRPPEVSICTRFEGTEARLEIGDNGPGIEEKYVSKVFEPFFTTKPIGTGTGLGLAVSYMIVTNQHQGSMELSTGLGEGSKFIIRLPLEYKV